MIKKLYIKGFGRIADRELEFADGLNIITGGNESGKSTVAAFIKAMLYGMPSKKGRSSILSDRKRYAPWSGGDFGGSMEIRDASGRDMLIERTFRESASRDTLKTSDPVSGADIEGLAGEPGYALYGVEGDTFERTAFIAQNGILTRGNDEIAVKLANLIRSADEDVSLSAARKSLEEKRRYLYTKQGSGGKLNKLTQQLAALRAERSQAELRRREELAALEKRRAVELETERIRGEIQTAEGWRTAEVHLARAQRYVGIVKAANACSEAAKRIDEVRAEISVGDFTPDRAWLDNARDKRDAYIQARGRAEREAARLDELEGQIESTAERIASLGTAGSDPDLIDTARNLIEKESRLSHSLAGVREEEQRRARLEQDIAACTHPDREALSQPRAAELINTPRGKGRPLRIILAAAAAAAIAVGAEQIYKSASAYPGAIFLAAGAILCAVLLIIGKDRALSKELASFGVSSMSELREKYAEFTVMEARRSMLEEELAKTGGEICSSDIEKELEECRQAQAELYRDARCCGADDLRIVCDEARNLAARRELLYEQRDKQSAAAADLREKCAALRAEAVEALAPVAAGDDPHMDAVIEKMDSLLDRLDEYIRLNENTQENYRSLTDGADFDVLRRSYEWVMEKEIRSVPLKREEIEKRITELTARLSELTAQAAVLDAREDEGMSPGEVDELIESVGEQIRTAKRSLDAVSTALDALGEADGELRSSFGPRLCSAALEHMEALTLGKYDAMQVDNDCAVRLRGEDHLYHDAESFSAGTYDQIYLSVRLALVGLLEGDEKIPVILDDAFCQSDDERLRAGLEILKAAARNGRQILLFTCHGREETLAADGGQVNTIVMRG